MLHQLKYQLSPRRYDVNPPCPDYKKFEKDLRIVVILLYPDIHN